MEYSIISLILAALLGLIPANIAKKKGHSFGLWWFYGFMIFIVAIIHVQFIKDRNAPENRVDYSPAPPVGRNIDVGPADRGAAQGLYSNADDSYGNQYSSPAPAYPASPVPTPAYPVNPAPAPVYAPVQRPVVYATGRQPTGNKVYLDVRPVLVGRGTDCSIRYPNGTPGVSGRHCSIAWDTASGQFIVTDLGSSFGTYTDAGQKLSANAPYRLLPGTEIRIGDKDNTLRLAVE